MSEKLFGEQAGGVLTARKLIAGAAAMLTTPWLEHHRQVSRMQAEITHRAECMIFYENALREQACKTVAVALGPQWSERCHWQTTLDRPLWMALCIDDQPTWEVWTDITGEKFTTHSRWLTDLERFR